MFVSETPLVTEDLVDTGLVAADWDEATRRLAELLYVAGRVTDLEGFLADVRDREERMPTGMHGRVALPHARSTHVPVPSLAVGVCADGVDFSGPDGPARFVFLIAAPASGGEDHMRILSGLARMLVRADFRTALRRAPDARAVADELLAFQRRSLRILR
ncbi:PTS system fructose-specific IIA component [Nocardiopsis mwathae]|uniref:PTS system fructose-specific IIA component n=1 Tax=Nocardiopsis mwathae TaxID=1472723 RepID=A0A7W9YJ04_9ACTN|nr:PTS sugar transporter subunit IIA [Nocardiopsis mwathae]MBB6173023.1 PTS system fructose-specific IIA component [Nocardiopsis mwathae]